MLYTPTQNVNGCKQLRPDVEQTNYQTNIEKFIDFSMYYCNARARSNNLKKQRITSPLSRSSVIKFYICLEHIAVINKFWKMKGLFKSPIFSYCADELSCLSAVYRRIGLLQNKPFQCSAVADGSFDYVLALISPIQMTYSIGMTDFKFWIVWI